MTDESVINIASVRAAIQNHLTEAKRLQDALDLILSVNSPVEPQIKKSIFIPSLKKPVLTGTFKDNINRIFELENKPLGAKSLLAIYIDKTGKEVSYATFSGQFSGLVSRDKKIKKYSIDSNPIESRYFYGLPAWFDGEILKGEYLEKIQ